MPRIPHPLELLQPKSLVRLSGYLQNLIKKRLWLKILIGMVLGIGVGTLLGPSADLVPQNIARPISNWLAIPGQIFLVLVQMMENLLLQPLIFLIPSYLFELSSQQITLQKETRQEI